MALEGGAPAPGGNAGGSTGEGLDSSGASAELESDASSSNDGGSTEEESRERRPPSPAKAPAKPGAKKPDDFRFKDKFKINGKEEEREFSRDELRRMTQLGLAQEDGFSQIKAERAKLKQEREELQRIMRGAKGNPDAVLKLFGLDPEEYAAAKLERHIEMSKLTPEQRENMTLREQMKARDDELAKHKKDTEERSAREAEDRAWQEYQPRMLQAAAELGLPKEPYVADMLASVGHEFMEAELNLDPIEHAREVNRRLGDLATRHISKLSVPQLKALLGPKRLKELNAANIAEAQKSSFDRMQNAPDEETPEAPKKRPTYDGGLSEEDFLAVLHGRSPRRR